MENIFFFQTQQIPDDSNIFNQLLTSNTAPNSFDKKQKIFYSYFQVDKDYYLFLYAQQSIDINIFYQSIEIIKELDSKQRKIRSFRGFFLYALETIENGKDYEILKTNLQPFFWRKVKDTIRQNKKAALQEFLFGEEADNNYDNKGSNLKIQLLENQIKHLQNQVNSLQQKVIQLETFRKNSKDPLTDPIEAPNPKKTIQQYNLHLNQEKSQNEHNFITLSKLSEDQKIEIIKTGFQLNQEGKISLKKYYETNQEYSLFQSKGYSIKYETVRRTKLYQNLNQ